MVRMISTLPTPIALACSLLVAAPGCVDVDPSFDAPASEQVAASAHALAADGGVEVTVTQIAPDRYIVVATATFDRSVGKIWATLHNFEKLVEVALPGVASDFEWLDGSPGQIPSTFQFDAGDSLIVEEVYYRSKHDYTMRYRLLEPALGISALEAGFMLTPISNKETLYTATRDVTLEPGVTIDGLADLIAVETQNLESHFSKGH